MASQYTNNKKILRKTKKLYYSSAELQQGGQAMKVLEFQAKLHQIMANSKDQNPVDQLNQINVEDLPVEIMQKWLRQMGMPTTKIDAENFTKN